MFLDQTKPQRHQKPKGQCPSVLRPSKNTAVGGARMPARSTGTNPVATRGFTVGKEETEVAQGCSDGPVQPPPF